MKGRQAYDEAVERLWASVRRPPGQARRALIDRAVGLLAGRVRCRLEDAHGRLLKLAQEQGRDLEEVAAGVIDLLEVDAAPADWPADAQPPLLDHVEIAPAGRSAADAIAARLRDRLVTPGTPAEPAEALAVVLFGVRGDASLRMVGQAGIPASELPEWLWLSAGMATAAQAAVRSGRAVWLPSANDQAANDQPAGPAPDGPAPDGPAPDGPAAETGWPARAWLPVRGGGRVVGVVGVLWRHPGRLGPEPRRVVSRAAAETRRELRRLLTADQPPAGDDWPRLVQEILDTLPGSAALLSPILDPAGEVVDYLVDAASPEATDVLGRSGAQLVGLRISDGYPATVGSELWTEYAQVLRTGDARQVGPFDYSPTTEGVPNQARFSVRVHRLGGRLMISWVRHDEQGRFADRLAQTERLGNLGWGEWDLLTGRVDWSEQLYKIYERDPALGPMPTEESEALVLPEDTPIRAAAAEEFVRTGKLDTVLRIRINGRIKYIRSVIDAVRDVGGNPLKIYGIIQDVTARETTLARLDRIEHELAEQRRTAEAEHRLASQLQHIILPIPEHPLDLPGIRVALRYLPAEHLSHVGGDWYHAGGLSDGTVLLAVGDVAGHGMLAATTMAQLRHALRAFTVTTTEPAQLMAGLNRLLVEIAPETSAATATAVIARYDPRVGELNWAQAGHPAPLLSRDGITVPLNRPPGMLLGVNPAASYTSDTIGFHPGDVLVLYTDGLVEHRNRTLDEGLATAIRTVDTAIAERPTQPLAALLSMLRRANPDDDTCILAARPVPTTHSGIEDHHG